MSPGQNSVVANDANTAKNGGGTASASEQLRTILQLRGVNIGDEEFEAMLETEQAKSNASSRVQQLQEEEDEVEFSDNAPAPKIANSNIEQDYNEDKAELTKKLQELQQPKNAYVIGKSC